MIKGGNTVWWGDLKSKPVTQGGGILELGRTTTVGYKYFLGCQFMLCHGPLDALVDIQADGKSIPYTASQVLNGNATENFIEVVATGDNLFGGTSPGGGGGISGIINFYRGLQTQQPDDYLTQVQGRVVLDQSGIGFQFHGDGNGTISSLSAGASALDETFTITATGIDGDNTHSTFGKMRFNVVGSTSGTQHNQTLNSDGSNGCWADQAFSSSRINLTITTGSTQYSVGDTFTISTQHAKVVPAYRGLSQAVFKQLYVGTSNYLKPLAFVVRRCPDPFSQGAGVANINGDGNPALFLYEVITNVDWGLGVSPAAIDAASFQAAAVTLADEGLGIAMQFDTQASADQLAGEVLRHCDGLVYTDPETGLWTLKLARADYDPSTIPVLDVDNLLETPEIARGSWTETTNMLTIRYCSRAANFEDGTIRAYDPANIKVSAEVRPQVIDFKGLSSESAAGLVAMRVLKTLTYPLAKGKFAANRAARKLRPGGVFKLNWIPLGIENQVYRITRISYGDLLSGKISLDAVEDIFGINSVAFVAPPPSGWTNPVGAPQPNSHEHLEEMPFDLVLSEGRNGGGVIAMASRNVNTAVRDFQVWRDDGSGYFDTLARGSYCPVGVLATDYPAGTTAVDTTIGLTISAASIDTVLLEAVTAAVRDNGQQMLLVDGEFMAWQTPVFNDDGSVTILGNLRGAFDTVPADHSAGALVYFFSQGNGLAGNMANAGDVCTAKLLPENTVGVLPVSSATPNVLTLVGRTALPYPPGNVRMQGAAYGTRYTTITGNLVLTFSTRSLNLAGGRPLLREDAGDQPLPFGVGSVYKAMIGVTTVIGETVTTSPTTITAAQRAGFGATPHLGLDPVDVFIYAFEPQVSPLPTLYSYQQQHVRVIFTGFGMVFGEYFGGLQQ